MTLTPAETGEVHCDYYFLRTGDMYLNLASDLSPGLEIIVFVSNDRGR